MAATLLKRYDDAYAVARGMITLGGAIKVAGLVAGLITVVAGVALIQEAGVQAGLGGILVGLVLSGSLYGLGTHISAQGQVLAATIDTAVNTSPLLSDVQKARAMSL